MPQAQIIFTLPLKIVKRKSMYESSCPPLDVHSQGETEAQARKNLGEALSLFLISCYERGALEEVLKQSGFKPMEQPRRASHARRKEDYIRVPLELIALSQKTGRECHT